GRSHLLALELGDRTAAGWALGLAAYVRGYAGEHAAAQAALEEVVATAADDDLRLDALVGLGDLLLQAGPVREARSFLVRAAALAGASAGHWQAGRLQLFLGITAHLSGDGEEAARRLAESLSLLQGTANWYGVAAAFDVIGAAVVGRGDATNALRLASAASALRDAIGAPLPSGWQAQLEARVLEPALPALPPAGALA